MAYQPRGTDSALESRLRPSGPVVTGGPRPGGTAWGLVILTGAPVPVEEETRHSGAGRIARMRRRPMSLYELGFATGEISLEARLDGDPPPGRDPRLSVAG